MEIYDMEILLFETLLQAKLQKCIKLEICVLVVDLDHRQGSEVL